MKLVVGLGNPGKKYEQTRHNIGWRLIDSLRAELEFADFKTENKFQSTVSEGKWTREKIILAKPLTFMNDSGKAVRLLQLFYKISAENILVIRDDLDLEFGKYRERKDSSSGGHNGINSIVENTASQAFTQIKIGIKNDYLAKMDPSDFVLKKFNRKEKKELKELLPKFIANIQKLLENEQ